MRSCAYCNFYLLSLQILHDLVIVPFLVSSIQVQRCSMFLRTKEGIVIRLNSYGQLIERIRGCWHASEASPPFPSNIAA